MSAARASSGSFDVITGFYASLYSRGVPHEGAQAMAIAIDPVCGMQVDTEQSELKLEHDGTTYWFCGKGCLLEFKDDPDKYLAPDYTPSM
jgi:YHS domain-containing protein